MKILEKIKLPIKQEMDLFEEKFSKSMISDVPLLNRITHYVVKRKGKKMRPMFVFLTAKMMSGNGFPQECATFRRRDRSKFAVGCVVEWSQ